MRACQNLECPFIRSGRKAARFDDDVWTCTHCGKPLSAPFAPDVRRGPPPKELRGVPVDSLGICVGGWCTVQRQHVGRAVGVVATMALGAIGLVMLAASPVAGAVFLVGAAGGGMWLAIGYRPAAVRLYERGFEYERGSVHIGIAFAALRTAALTETKVRVRGVHVGWQLRLDLEWDVGALVLVGNAPGATPTPEGPFHDFAMQVVGAHQRRVV